MLLSASCDFWIFKLKLCENDSYEYSGSPDREGGDNNREGRGHQGKEVRPICVLRSRLTKFFGPICFLCGLLYRLLQHRETSTTTVNIIDIEWFTSLQLGIYLHEKMNYFIEVAFEWPGYSIETGYVWRLQGQEEQEHAPGRGLREWWWWGISAVMLEVNINFWKVPCLNESKTGTGI